MTPWPFSLLAVSYRSVNLPRNLDQPSFRASHVKSHAVDDATDSLHGIDEPFTFFFSIDNFAAVIPGPIPPRTFGVFVVLVPGTRIRILVPWNAAQTSVKAFIAGDTDSLVTITLALKSGKMPANDLRGLAKVNGPSAPVPMMAFGLKLGNGGVASLVHIIGPPLALAGVHGFSRLVETCFPMAMCV